MFLKHIPAIMVLTVALVLCDSAIRADDPPQVQETKTITGTISVLQKATKQLVLKTSDGKDVILNLDSQTTVKLENDNLNWFELKEGMPASITYLNPPKASQFIVTTIIASKPDPNVVTEKPKGSESPDSVEPITIKGKVDYVKSDLSEITIKTFGDKLITLQVDDDWRNRIKNGVANVPSLAKGTEIGAIYIVHNGKNKMIVLRDIINTEPSSGTTVNPIPPSASTTPRMLNNQQNINNSQTLVLGQTNGLPLVSMPLPLGFAALSNQVSGALVGEIVQVKKDAAILTSGTAAPLPPRVPPTGSVSNPPQGGLSNPVNGASQSSPSAPVARDYFVMLVNGSKEPMIVDQATTITMGNRKAGLQELVDGTKLFVNFEVLADGSRHVVTIRATNEQPAKTSDIVQAGQNGNPPIQQNQNANPSFQANAISAQVLRNKAGAVFAQTQNEILVLMTSNSGEPLRIDDRTRFTVNNREARFTDLQVGMKAQVFLETYNQMRRVIGVVASQEGVPSQPRNGDGGLTGDK